MINNLDQRSDWENVYKVKDEKEVSWFEECSTISLDLIRSTGVNLNVSVIDIGGGSSRLADALLDERFTAVTILDLSERSLAKSKARLGTRSAKVHWVVADVATWEPSQPYDVWHDRAAFHFLTGPKTELPMLRGSLKPCDPEAM